MGHRFDLPKKHSARCLRFRAPRADRLTLSLVRVTSQSNKGIPQIAAHSTKVAERGGVEGSTLFGRGPLGYEGPRRLLPRCAALIQAPGSVPHAPPWGKWPAAGGSDRCAVLVISGVRRPASVKPFSRSPTAAYAPMKPSGAKDGQGVVQPAAGRAFTMGPRPRSRAADAGCIADRGPKPTAPGWRYGNS